MTSSSESGVGNVEYLPVQILNHKKKVASKDYFLMNPLSVVDCIDVEASEVEWDVVRKDFIESCESLVIQGPRVPADVHVFRPKHLRVGRIWCGPSWWTRSTKQGSRACSFTPAEDFQGV